MTSYPERPAVLYLDDEPYCLDVFLEMFSDDYDVRTARTHEEARRALRERAFDIVVSDQCMPDGEGVAFLAEAARAQPAAFRILLTGRTHLGALVREMAAGVFHLFATKPWTEHSMRENLERARTHDPVASPTG